MNDTAKPIAQKALALSLMLAAGGTVQAGVIAFETFGDAVNNSPINPSYQSTTPGYSQGLSGAWSVLNNGNNSSLKHRASSFGWDGAQANLTTIGSGYSLKNGGYFNFLETGGNWGLEVAHAGLSTSIDMTQNGTWYMSFIASSGNFDYAAQIGLNNGVNEVMWGNGYSGGSQGVTAYYGAMSSFNAGNALGVKGSSGVSPTMGSAYNVMLYVAQLQQVVGTGLTLNMYAFDLNTTTGLPSDISLAGPALWSTTLSGVNDTFTNFELKLSGADTWPSVSQPRLGTTWTDVTTVPEPSAAALMGIAGLMGLHAFRRRQA